MAEKSDKKLFRKYNINIWVNTINYFEPVPDVVIFFDEKMLNLFNKIPIFEDYYMYQAPLTPEEEDEYVYNYLTEKRLGEEIQVGRPMELFIF